MANSLLVGREFKELRGAWVGVGKCCPDSGIRCVDKTPSQQKHHYPFSQQSRRPRPQPPPEEALRAGAAEDVDHGHDRDPHQVERGESSEGTKAQAVKKAAGVTESSHSQAPLEERINVGGGVTGAVRGAVTGAATGARVKEKESGVKEGGVSHRRMRVRVRFDRFAPQWDEW